MHDLDLIFTLTGGLTAALIFGALAHKLKLSPIVGYLIAGVIVGPFTPGFVAHAGIARQFAELGVILLMFGVGLQFHVEELLAVKRVAIPGALVGMTVSAALAALVARAAGWSSPSPIVFGLTVSAASTVVLMRMLGDRGALHTPVGHVAVGWLVVEDVITVLMLVMLPIAVRATKGEGTNASDADAPHLAVAVVVAVAKVVALVVFTMLVGRRVLPRVLSWVAKTRSRDLFTLTVLVLALGIAVGSAKLFGASMALGAFLAGIVVGQSSFGSRAASDALPMRDAFAVLFFVSIGMLFEPAAFAANARLAGATVAVVLVGKPLAAFMVARTLGHPTRSAATIGVSLAQIGEFSFVTATLATELGVLPASATQVLVVTSIVTITLNPFLFRLVDALTKRTRDAYKAQHGTEREQPAHVAHRCIVVGYGPVGRTLTRLLTEQGFVPTVVELNHETVEQLRAVGVRAVYGDASQRDILQRAGVEKAVSLVFAASGTPPEAVIHAARALNENIRIFSRSATLVEAAKAREAGAHTVVTAEVEVALAMTELLLADLGATSDQLDRARDKVRQELA